MFERSKTDNRRVIIIDVQHMAYKAAYGNMPPLSVTINVAGELRTINTNIQSFIIKSIHRWSCGGVNPTVVCFDGKGGNSSRKAYFAAQKGIVQTGSTEYKGNRSTQNSGFYDAINMTREYLYRGGVNTLRADKFEADDLVKASVDAAKIQYPDLPIDVITGDADLVPLVDEQVSVFLTSRKTTYAESDDIKKPHYVQLRPHNYQSYMEGLTSYKTIVVPYNTILLAKLLRGDKSDGIPGYPKFTPSKYKKLIEDMQNDGVDLAGLFRYDQPKRVLCYRDTGLPIPADQIESTPTEKKAVLFEEPPKLTEIKATLSKYLDEDIVKHCEMVYNGINLNGVFHEGLTEPFWRMPANLNNPIKGYTEGVLQKALLDLHIRLPKV